MQRMNQKRALFKSKLNRANSSDKKTEQEVVKAYLKGTTCPFVSQDLLPQCSPGVQDPGDSHLQGISRGHRLPGAEDDRHQPVYAHERPGYEMYVSPSLHDLCLLSFTGMFTVIIT